MALLNSKDPASAKFKQILAIKWGVIYARKYAGGDAAAQRGTLGKRA